MNMESYSASSEWSSKSHLESIYTPVCVSDHYARHWLLKLLHEKFAFLQINTRHGRDLKVKQIFASKLNIKIEHYI